MSFDIRSFLSGHPALVQLGQQIETTLLDVAEDAAKAAVGTIPFAGGAIEALSSPLLDSLKASLEAKAAEFIASEFAKLTGTTPAPVVVAPVAPVATALRGANPSMNIVADPRTASKQAMAAQRNLQGESATGSSPDNGGSSTGQGNP